ncbi:MAG TPA: SDR family NAD(P)-dependent oxidoreductase, partial [Thermoleophilia bacterium]|nr:SDR family NAD(P)-dependent oxidoreductase [Thermoleophilia bacterium]
MQISGSSALITGGASGLGEACARRLAAAGAAVTILDRNAERAEAVAKDLGGAAKAVSADVTDPEQVAQAVAIANEDAPLRIVGNCAGLGWAGRVINRDGSPHDLEAFRFIININLIGSFNVMRLAASAMSGNQPIEGERGVIVNTASAAAFDGQIGQAAYSASKGGIVGLTLPAARDLSAVGIRVMT